MIPTEDKTQKQITQETMEAFKKFSQVSEKATNAFEEKQWRDLLDMAKNRGKQKAEERKSKKIR